MLNGIDISGWQSGIDVASVDADFVIVKATGGTSFVNPDFRRQADQTLASGKLLGLYHFAGDNNPGSWEEEAAHFLSTVSDYVGRAVMVLDWEADATEWPIEWAENWLQRVADSTGSTPWFYSYSSYVNSHDCSSIARFPLWIAAYYAGYEPMGYQDNPPLYGGTGAWPDKVCYQYSSTGDVGGYDGRLDINKFYGSRDDFAAFYGGSGVVDTYRIDRFCDAMRWAADSDQVGYSQTDRWDVEFYGDGQYNADCSSLVIQAAQFAGYDVDGATYTGNMAQPFERAGFTRVDNDGNPGRGYVLLNEGNHVAVWLGDCLAQASIDENGQIAGGARGDQTGEEVNTRSYYDYPWDFYLKPPADKSTRTEDEPMQFIYQPDGKPYLVYHDGTKNIGLNNPDQAVALQDNYRRCTGRDLPCFALGTPESPWAARFEQVFPYMEASDVWGGHAK